MSEVTWEEAVRAAEYYCAVRDLEEELEADFRDHGDYESGYLDHPEWYDKCDALNDNWALTEREQEVLGMALETGLCDYFGPEDIIDALTNK